MKQYSLPKNLERQAMVAADNELYSEHILGKFDDGNPNNPRYNNGYNYATGQFTLFGYVQEELMDKQYK